MTKETDTVTPDTNPHLFAYHDALETWNGLRTVWLERLNSLQSKAIAEGCPHPEKYVTESSYGDEGYASDVIHYTQRCRVCKMSRETGTSRGGRGTEWRAE